MISYFVIRLFGFLIALLPYRAIHLMGCLLGSVIYYGYPPLRKKAMSNVSIAFGHLYSEEKRKAIVKGSLNNVMITCLEFFKIRKKHLKKIIKLGDTTAILNLQQQRQSIVFLTGHQANWEIPFLAINMLSPGGVAVGRPINNPYLYKWVLSVREMNGGKIVMPRQAMKEGLRYLKQGKYIGIVGDQALPESDYCYPLFGTRVWLSTAPALLAYKTNSPLIVGTTRRLKGNYEVLSSEPYWPDKSKSMKEAVVELMNKAFAYLEQSILQCPEQWMWIHDRWKQQTIDHVKREYRYGFILVILPADEEQIRQQLMTIYSRSFLTFMSPNDPLLLARDWRFQLVLDFVGMAHVRRHYRRLGATKALYLTKDQLKQTLVKPECLHTVSI